MSQYRPDRWIVLEFTYKETVVQKVFAGWYGGFADGDSWKLNSGITVIRLDDGLYEFDGYSGSTYICHENCHGMSGYMAQILAGWRTARPELQIKEIDLEDIVAS